MQQSEHIGENTLLDWVEGRLDHSRERATDEHLASCPECRQVVRIWSWTGDEAAGPASLIGSRVGRFEIRGVLGAGAMGVVLQAHDPSLDRDVALKRLAIAAPDREHEARILLEARALARLRHPNVVRVFEVGVHEGQPFLAMEWVRGVTLEDWLDTPRRYADITEIFAQVARGLAAVHEAGLVHRDVKPSNVMVDEHGHALVMDFGLVSGAGDAPATGGDGEVRPSSWERFQLSATGNNAGTPAFMSPEQLRGERADARSDQYSFCVALYRALVGAPPFSGTSLQTWSQQVLAGQSIPPPRRVPRHLRALLARGMATEPADRYPSMEALRAELERRPRRRLALAALALALLGAGAAAAYFVPRAPDAASACAARPDKFDGVWDASVQQKVRAALLATGAPYAEDTWRHLRSELDRYQRAWQATYVATCEATAVHRAQSPQLLDARMACLDRGLDEVRATMDALTAPELRIRGVAAAIDQLWRPEACAQLSLDGSKVALDAESQRLRAKERAMTARHRLRPPDEAARREASDLVESARALGKPWLEAAFTVQLASLLERAGDYEEALAALERAAQLAQSVDDLNLAADAWLRIAELHAARTHDFEAARRWLGYAEAAMKSVGPSAISHTSGEPFDHWLWQVQAILAKQEGRLDDALASYRKSLQLRERHFGQDSLQVAAALNNMAIALTLAGDSAEAFAASERALAIKERVLGGQHPSVGNALITLSLNYKNRGRYQRAMELLGRAIAILEHEPAAKLYWATALINRGIVESRLGLVEASQASFAAGKAVYAAGFGADSAQMATVLDNEGYGYYLAGRYDLARATHEQALAMARAVLGPDHPTTGNIERNLGADLLAQGKARAARAHLDSALRIRGAALGQGSPELAYELTALADCDLAEGKLAAARARATRALGLIDPEDSQSVAELRFVMARALWPEPAQRAAARGHAELALELVAQAEGVSLIRDALEGWLAAHPRL